MPETKRPYEPGSKDTRFGKLAGASGIASEATSKLWQPGFQPGICTVSDHVNSGFVWMHRRVSAGRASKPETWFATPLTDPHSSMDPMVGYKMLVAMLLAWQASKALPPISQLEVQSWLRRDVMDGSMLAVDVILDVPPHCETHAKAADGHIHMLVKLHALGICSGFFRRRRQVAWPFVWILEAHDPEHSIVCTYRVASCDKKSSIEYR
jgi:hypothetical protein